MSSWHDTWLSTVTALSLPLLIKNQQDQ